MLWKLLSIPLIVITVGIASGIALGGCAKPHGAHKEQRCTAVFETPNMVIMPEGIIVIDQKDLVSLTCAETWVAPNE